MNLNESPNPIDIAAQLRSIDSDFCYHGEQRSMTAVERDWWRRQGQLMRRAADYIERQERRNAETAVRLRETAARLRRIEE